MVFAGKGSPLSNLDCLLRCTTPVVPSHLLPKSEMRNLNKSWHPWAGEEVEYFTLGDVWECYDEWSFYGAGVPLSLTSTPNDEADLVQYYVPYLSALQIFTSTPPPLREETDSGDSESWSDEGESDKVSSRWDGSSSEEGGSEQDTLWQPSNKFGYLYCQYFESSTPYKRVPLKDKVTSLAERHPGLMSLKSAHLSPASWMAVSWYPIYSIPMGKTIKDLSTCFLTYHTLSSSFQDTDYEGEVDEAACDWSKRKQGEGTIPLPPFGVATYKMQGNLWVSGRGGQDQERLASFLGVADSWLKQLRVQHHDFDFFTRNLSGMDK